MCLLPPPIQYITLILNKTYCLNETQMSVLLIIGMQVVVEAHYAVYMYVHCTQEMITKYTCKL